MLNIPKTIAKTDQYNPSSFLQLKFFTGDISKNSISRVVCLQKVNHAREFACFLGFTNHDGLTAGPSVNNLRIS